MLLKNKQVAIIGAGPVGLTMARLLQQKGAAVTVYERDKDAQTRIWGGTLDLHAGSGQDAMEKAGLLERYYNLAKPMGRIITDEHCNVLFSVEPKKDNPEINRNDLRTLLLESLSVDTIVWDRKFTGLEMQEGKWLLHFEDQPDAVADVVIGANGGMSKARKYVTDATIEYSGSFIIQGEVTAPQLNCPAYYKLCDGNILMTAANGIQLVANPDNNGALTYGIIMKTPAEWTNGSALDFKNKESVAAYLTERCAGWDECYEELFRATTFFVGLPTRKISLEQAWKQERSLPITLIGDAAHIMPPFAGQGVNIGMVDAAILAENLTNGKFETIDAAISDYERQMFVYAKEAQAETNRNEIAMHAPDFSFAKRFVR